MEYAKILANQVFIMFLLIIIGFVLYKIKFISKETNTQLTNLVLYVVIPAMILNTYQMDYDVEKAKNMLLGFLLAFVSIVIAIIISNLMRIGSNQKSLGTERFCIVFTNCGFMAIPLMNAIFGQIGVFYCNTYLTVFNFIVWTYGVVIMKKSKQNQEEEYENKKQSLKQKLKPFLTPTMFSIFIGIAMYFLQIKFPSSVQETLGYVASMNTPLAMIISGVYIAQSDLIGALKNKRVYSNVVLKSFVVPLAVLALFYILPLDETLKLTILIATACPTAANAMLFANRFDGDVERASNVFTLSTLMSIISLPVIILVATSI